MAEIAIKSHTRKGKNGKTVTVRGYTRRVGRKGHISPKKDDWWSGSPGEELQAKIVEKEVKRPTYTGPKMTREEARKWDEAARKDSNMSFSRRDQLSGKGKVSSHSKSVKNPLSEQGSLQIAQRIEDKIARFIEKYSGRKYKKVY